MPESNGPGQTPARPANATVDTTPSRKPDPALTPSEEPGEVPDIGAEFTTAGVDKETWKNPKNKKQVDNQDPERFLL